MVRKQEERKMKVKEIVSVLFHRDNVRIHDSHDFKVIYSGNKKDVPEDVLDQNVKYMSVYLDLDIDTYNYLPTLVITLGSQL